MKKPLVVLLILTLCLGLLAGCGDHLPPEFPLVETPVPAETTESTEPVETTEPTESTEPVETTEPTESTETTAPTTVQEELSAMEKIQRQLEEENALCAIAFLGASEGDFTELMTYLTDMGMVDAYPVLEDLTYETFVENSGMELYLIIQRENVGLSVHEQSMDPETGEMLIGNSLYIGYESAPVLLRCNISDIVPNLFLTLENPTGEYLEYSPFISLRDGSVNVTDGILDLTEYSLIYGEHWEREE